MRLKVFGDIRLVVTDDRTRKKHTAGLASDHAGADHVIPYREVILRREILLYHLAHLLVAGHHDIAHAAAVLGDIYAAFIKGFRAVERPVPGVRILLFRGALRVTQYVIKSARLNAVEDRLEFTRIGLICMRQEHSLRVPVPYLLGTHVYILAV